jgi:hypothetical protein
MKQIFLHIGVHKTGSSSLQFFLHKNIDRLRELGYLYPLGRLNHYRLASTLIDSSQQQLQFKLWNRTIKEIETKDLDKVIISSEGFVESTKPEFIQQVAEKLKQYQTKVIIYLRRQDQKVESSFTQRLKAGVVYSDIHQCIDQYLRKNSPINYLKILNNWSEFFGRENIIVRPLEKQQVPNLYQDFLKQIGIDSLEGFEMTQDCNTKPNLAQIAAINFINQQVAKSLNLNGEEIQKLDLKSSQLWKIKYPKSLLEYTQHWQSKTKYNLIPYEKAVEILKVSEKQNAQVAKRFLNREDGCLFSEQLTPYEHDSLDINNLDKQQLIDFISYLCLVTKDCASLDIRSVA